MKKKVFVILTIVVILSAIIFGISLNRKKNTKDNKDQKQYEVTEQKTKDDKFTYKYEAFVPSFVSSDNQQYDFTMDMKYKDNIYHRKINNYDEYKEVKDRWNNILDMTEEDFKTKFMVITAVENVSMIGLDVDEIACDNNNLYIALKHTINNDFDSKKSCISYILSRDYERENIIVTRNLLDEERDYSENMTISKRGSASENENSTYEYSYDEKNGLSPKNFVAENFVIKKECPNIDFSNWKDLGNDYYSYEFTSTSKYLKFANQFGAPIVTWYDMKNAYVTIIVKKDSNSLIKVNDSIENIDGSNYLKVSDGGFADLSVEPKYMACAIILPNYRLKDKNKVIIEFANEEKLDSEYFCTNVNVLPAENMNRKISVSEARKIAQYGFEASAKSVAGEGADDKDSEIWAIKSVHPNNYFYLNEADGYRSLIYTEISRNAYVVTRTNDMGNGISVYVDCTTGLIIGGEAFGD